MTATTLAELLRSPVPSEAALWRRFNINEPHHVENVLQDEATGTPKLKGGALDFRGDGCSVFRGDVLEALSLYPRSVTFDPYLSLASAVSGEVEDFRSGLADDGSSEFAVVGDPLDPDPDFNAAHTLIQQVGAYSSGGRRRRAQGLLAQRVFVIHDV